MMWCPVPSCGNILVWLCCKMEEADRQSTSLDLLHEGEETMPQCLWDPTHTVKEILDEDITAVCKCERSGMERAVSLLRIGLSLGNKWHAGEAEHL